MHRRTSFWRGWHRASRVGCERLEARALVATIAVVPPTLPGNAGEIVDSQYWPYGYSQIGSQWRDVSVGGPVTIRQVTPFNPSGADAAASDPPPDTPPTVPPANTGLVTGSQYDVGGFSAIGSQLRGIRIGGRLSIDSYDESIGQDADGGSPPDPTGGGPRPSPQPLPDDPTRVPFSSTSSGLVSNSQFNDGGFGNVGLQWERGSIGGDLDIVYRSLIGYPDGQGPSSGGLLAVSSLRDRPALMQAGTNTGRITDSQFNDGGFGTVGMQWGEVDVAGSVAVGFETFVIQPQVVGESPFIPVPDSHGRPPPGPTTSTATNTGEVLGSQFSDGGFGDIGLQWSGVTVTGRLATSTNGLSVHPLRNDVGPITTGGMVFGQGDERQAAAGRASLSRAPAGGQAVATGSQALTAAAGGYTENDATNSGSIVASQFSDGGFGDIGLQWQGVSVGGSVTAVHNALSVQPENDRQGQITVEAVAFPGKPGASPPATPGVPQLLPPDPTPVVRDGPAITPDLTRPTGPGDTTFPVNRATNSGDVLASQFSDGGFGDIGLQWRDVRVAGDVRVVHNSLSVQPEGMDLAGVTVRNVTFGVPQGGAAAAVTSGSPFAPRTLRSLSVAAGRSTRGGAGRMPAPPLGNTRTLTDRQVSGTRGGDVVLQWNGVTQADGGLVIVRNSLVVQNQGLRAGSVRLENIRFPGRLPRTEIAPRWMTPAARGPSGPRDAAAPRAAAGAAARAGRILDAATNSGTLSDNQFSDGGFGDIGLQWRGVSVGGGVTVVRNSLSVDVDGDARRTGPIVISGVTFHSGALDGGQPLPGDRVILAPPRMSERVATVPPVPAGPSVRDRGVVNRASNAGTLRGGQFADGGVGRVALQWQNVAVAASITIVDNVLTVQVAGRHGGPILIRDVTFS